MAGTDTLYNEPELLQRSADGDQAAFTELFHHYKDRLHHFLYKLTESTELTEDTIQEIFLKLWKARAMMPEIQNLGSYLYRMAQNHCINVFKRQAREALILAELQKTTPRLMPTTDEVLDAKAIQEKLKAALEKLSPQQRKVYQLSREQGLRHDQIAASLGISPSTVKGHMISALRTLREELLTNPGSVPLLVFFLAVIEAFEK